MYEILNDSIDYRVSPDKSFGVKYKLVTDGFEIALVDSIGEIAAKREYYDFISSTSDFKQVCFFCKNGKFKQIYDMLQHSTCT